jgi:drug/metabolite transporter (DMT)-like permease
MTPTDTRPDARTDAGAQEFGAGTVYTLLAALGFGAVSTLTSIALAERAGLWNVLMWRYVLGSVVMVAFVGTQHYPRMPWREALRFIAIGGGGQALLVGLALSSLRYITVATLGFLFLTYPAWVTLVQTVRGAERPTARRLLALALSFGGIAVIGAATAAASPASGAALRVSGLEWKGVALALGAAVVYGLYIPTMQYLQKDHPVPVTSAYAKIGSAVCFLLVATGTQSFTFSMSVTAWEAILALTLFSTVLPSVFFLMGLMRLGAVRTAIVSTVEPFFTAVLGALVLRQPITPSIVLGGAMIAGAVVTLQFRRERVA